MKYYIASKTKHATIWRQMRAQGCPIISTWIDEADKGQTKDTADLAARCITEAAAADVLVLYSETEETHKGALFEAGAALAAGKEVRLVGWNPSLDTAIISHPRCRHAPFINDAMPRDEWGQTRVHLDIQSPPAAPEEGKPPAAAKAHLEHIRPPGTVWFQAGEGRYVVMADRVTGLCRHPMSVKLTVDGMGTFVVDKPHYDNLMYQWITGVNRVNREAAKRWQATHSEPDGKPRSAAGNPG